MGGRRTGRVRDDSALEQLVPPAAPPAGPLRVHRLRGPARGQAGGPGLARVRVTTLPWHGQFGAGTSQTMKIGGFLSIIWPPICPHPSNFRIRDNPMKSIVSLKRSIVNNKLKKTNLTELKRRTPVILRGRPCILAFYHLNVFSFWCYFSFAIASNTNSYIRFCILTT